MPPNRWAMDVCFLMWLYGSPLYFIVVIWKNVTVSPSIPQHPRHLCMWRFCDFILLSGNQTWLSGKATIYWNSHLVWECSHNSWFLSICSHLFPWCSNKTWAFSQGFRVRQRHCCVPQFPGWDLHDLRPRMPKTGRPRPGCLAALIFVHLFFICH